MRVIAGQAKGTKLIGLKNSNVRPTLDQVRETLFNILGHDLSGEYFLDWFGGSGAVERKRLFGLRMIDDLKI